MFAILLPSSYTNKQTQYQMRRLIFVRDVYQRIVRDPRLLKSSPVMHDTKFARLAIKLLKDATKDENPEERLQKMEELA